MIIVGAGMAGLLAGRMLAHHHPMIIEQQAELPNNHNAVLRFRSTVIGDTLGIPFKKVSMIKDVLRWYNPVADSMAYSFKNASQYRSDRSITQGFKIEERYIAPPDLIQRMAQGLDIVFNTKYAGSNTSMSEIIISTIPMPVLAHMLNYPDLPKFEYAHGSIITATIERCDAYVSLLTPNPAYHFSRISITGNELIVECPNKFPEALGNYEALALFAARLLGVREEDVTGIQAPVAQQYNKILPINDEERKRFMYWATDKHSIFSLGRFATWRPTLLLDDLVKDVRLINEWATQRSHYEVRKHRSA